MRLLWIYLLRKVCFLRSASLLSELPFLFELWLASLLFGFMTSPELTGDSTASDTICLSLPGIPGCMVFLEERPITLWELDLQESGL